MFSKLQKVVTSSLNIHKIASKEDPSDSGSEEKEDLRIDEEDK